MKNEHSDYINLEVKEISLSDRELTGLIREVTQKNHSFRFRAKGSSMAPFIKNLDVITVSPLKDKNIKPGDIVAVSWPETGKLIVHRIIELKAFTCLTRGDNLGAGDGEIPLENILGIITRIERGGKNVRLGLGTGKYLVSLLSRSGMLQRLKRIFKTFRRSGHR